MKTLLTVEAIYDIADIADYIEDTFGSDRAVRFEVDLEGRLERLEDYEHADTGIRYNGYIYKDVFSPSLIFFVVIDDVIHVLRVLREERDWHRLLERKQRYDYL